MRRLHTLLAFSWLLACGDDPGTADRDPEPDAADDGSADAAPDDDATGDDAPLDTPSDTADGAAVADGSGLDGAEGDAADGSGAEDHDADAPEEAFDLPGDDADAAPPDCPDPPRFDYACVAGDASTCPEGLCLLGQCIAPVINADRWDDCGDGACAPCESAPLCPTDCAPRPALDGPRDYQSPATITISVHGFNVVDGAEFEDEIYGRARGTGGTGENIRRFAPGVPDGTREPDAVNQMIAVEYYGAIPADWLAPADVAEIEAYDWRTAGALHRYALIVGKFIRHITAQTGATHVNLFCHSMGCHVTRYLIENDVEGVASSGMLSRWYTITGVIGGARLARLFDNPVVRDAAELLNLNTSDFIHMNPDYVQDHSAVWDHRLRAANHPLFAGLLIHHIVGTDPLVSETADIVPLLDLNNPGNEPNDGIVYSWDEFFHEQDPEVQHQTPSGERVAPTATYRNLDHFENPDSVGAGILGAAALYHRRKAWITVKSITLRDDRERDSLFDFSEAGDPPAELSWRGSVRFNPYVQDSFGVDEVVHEQDPADRSTPVLELTEGSTAWPGWTVFEGPVFDEMSTVWVDFELLEMDWYPRVGITESVLGLDPHEQLARYRGAIPLEDGEVRVESEHAVVVLEVKVRELY